MSQAVKPMLKSRSIVQWGLVAVIASFVAVAALPNYFTGQWPWSADLPVPHIEQIRNLLKQPLDLPDWEIALHEEVGISRQQWTRTVYLPTGAEDDMSEGFMVLLRPQLAVDQQPEVEWVDLQGSLTWQVNDLHTVSFSPDASPEGTSRKVVTRYLRGLNERSTFAVMQWYAWPEGGHYAPGRWFWGDQEKQWKQREHLPWVAVSILLPIEPVGDIRLHTEEITAIAQSVQQALMSNTFSGE